ncbi:hypothetical protein FNV43_RR26412 [Rhamnella rubrinervis]|uniref:Uncharacterized protein n=1 Tax=Rhamnella rubrinervis TaxID=2594499 RepID=A0A8K0GRH4_9ROSA|nr:hypothetical protein FNV43_RR26412 [Rhamnella rubrinervis]
MPNGWVSNSGGSSFNCSLHSSPPNLLVFKLLFGEKILEITLIDEDAPINATPQTIRFPIKEVGVIFVNSTMQGISEGAFYRVGQTEVNGSLLKGKTIVGIEDVDEETVGEKEVIDGVKMK